MLIPHLRRLNTFSSCRPLARDGSRDGGDFPGETNSLAWGLSEVVLGSQFDWLLARGVPRSQSASSALPDCAAQLNSVQLTHSSISSRQLKCRLPVSTNQPLNPSSNLPTMKLSSVVVSVAVLACSMFSSQVAAQDKPLPWDGRGQDLTVATLDTKYMLHILKQRKGGMNGNPADYVTVDQKGRSPAYNKDTGVINIGVDENAIFNTQNNFRRSELVQNIAGNADGKTFFRTSVKKDEPFLNKYQWQIIFPEDHIFEIRIDAEQSPAKIIYLNNGTYDAKWETEFKTSTWYNFGIAVSKAASGSTLEFYESEGNKPLKLAKTHTVVSKFPTTYEFHYGMLTLSNDGTDPVMVKGEQDILSYNGVSVEAGVPADIGSGSATAPSTPTKKPAKTTKPATTPAAAATPAPATVKPICNKKN